MRACIVSSPTRARISSASATARLSRYRSPGPTGSSEPPSGATVGHCPVSPIASTSPTEATSASSASIAHARQSSADCSAHPGAGDAVGYGRRSSRTTRPDASTAHARAPVVPASTAAKIIPAPADAP